MRLIILFILLSLGADAQIIRANPFYRPIAATTGNLLLDDYPNAAVAYSLRKLDKDYTGSAIRVRKDTTGNPEQDIGFTVNGDLDTAALKTFLNARSGFVTTWYNQADSSGTFGVRNATQTTAANQPRIALNGVIDRQNGEIALRFLTSTNRLSSYKFAAPSTNWNIMTVASIDNVTGNNRNALGTDGGGFQSSGIYLQGTGNLTGMLVNRSGGANITDKDSIFNNTQFFTAHQYFSTDSAQTYLNNTSSVKKSMLISGNTFTSGNQTVYWIGAYRAGSTFSSTISLSGTIAEHIVYQSDQTNNMSGIRTNINNYYGLW